MPVCNNCGAHVTEDYWRVYAPEGQDGVGACPRCPDKSRDASGRPMETTNRRATARAVSED